MIGIPMAGRRVFLLSGLALLLSGCVSVPTPSKNEKVWNGRFSIQSTIDGKSDRNSGKFVFTHNDVSYSLSLYGPIGVLMAKLSDDGKRATLERPGEETMTSFNMESLTSIAIGFPIPLGRLTYWLEGKPLPDTPFTPGDSKNSFMQSGWMVAYTFGPENKIRRIDIQNEHPTPVNTIKLVLLLS